MGFTDRPLEQRVFADRAAMAPVWSEIRADLGRIVFTNGCFDLLHGGHVMYLEEARACGDFLVLGLNNDDSVRRLKGEKRPIVPFVERAAVLAALRAVDVVVGFAEDTPYELIQTVQPNVLVKGGDYRVAEIVGHDIVTAAGGEVRSLAFKPGSSTTSIVDTIVARYLP
ncbi:D-glycero-beta-D-manno-heptose 1-phosphate adenylyltransferase [Acanthopleuribacter pedis]|uniref:D-glycero-beta-D-manno-heptose 1-phosphate adenylyltransferase n=1 Tax=Acanthopleuribacter pedis TaxID=442870 RepID=A0A8J7QRE2_9BACT|nr:D-glycero-beta-D-manno-heptose 1-phosphate adenylyltransferase [Acanthopleuribacter pedis]MBO1322825.1 D-glycero-beta-D-manno-heptose 1-phosphate adenylyltransferase [Acanthopleuribacter pedis]